MIEFRGQQIFGTHDIILAAPAELQVVRTYFWGLRGESEIIGGPAGRTLSCYMWLHNQYPTRASIEQAIKAINEWIGENGVLTETDLHSQCVMTYNDVTFEGFTRERLGNSESDGAIFDYAGTVDGGWFQPGRLQFRQLKSVDIIS